MLVFNYIEDELLVFIIVENEQLDFIIVENKHLYLSPISVVFPLICMKFGEHIKLGLIKTS